MVKKREPITQEDRDWNQMMDPQVQKDRVDYILDNGKDLKIKELDFLNSCSQWLIKKRELTEPMAKWLQDIYNKVE